MRATNSSSQLTFNWDDPAPENEVVSSVSTSDCSTGSRAASGDSPCDLEAAAFGKAERLPLDFPCGATPAINGNDAQSLENDMEQTTQSKVAYGFVRPERQTVETRNRQPYPESGLAMSEKTPAYGEELAVKFTLDDYKQFRTKLSDQTLEIEELHTAFNSMLHAEEEFLSDLKSRFNATRMQGVARNLGKFAGRTKQENAPSIYDALLRSFYLKESFSYSPLQQSFKERLSELVPNQTADDLKSYYEARTKAQKAEQKIVENPETLSEFRELIRLKQLMG
jgi:hypothetical protein